MPPALTHLRHVPPHAKAPQQSTPGPAPASPQSVPLFRERPHHACAQHPCLIAYGFCPLHSCAGPALPREPPKPCSSALLQAFTKLTDSHYRYLRKRASHLGCRNRPSTQGQGTGQQYPGRRRCKAADGFCRRSTETTSYPSTRRCSPTLHLQPPSPPSGSVTCAHGTLTQASRARRRCCRHVIHGVPRH
jgi:hypothetical protein